MGRHYNQSLWIFETRFNPYTTIFSTWLQPRLLPLLSCFRLYHCHGLSPRGWFAQWTCDMLFEYESQDYQNQILTCGETGIGICSSCPTILSLYLVTQDHCYFQLQPHATHPYSTIAGGEVLQMDCYSLGVWLGIWIRQVKEIFVFFWIDMWPSLYWNWNYGRVFLSWRISFSDQFWWHMVWICYHLSPNPNFPAQYF